MADSDASGASGSALVRTRSRSLSPEDADQLAPLPVSQATRHSGRQRPRTASINQMHRSVELERPQTAGAGPLVDEDGAQGNVVVVCRVRPFNRRELSNIAAAPEPEEARDAAESTVSISEDMREVTLHTRGDQDHSFGFRRIFATRTTQEEVCLWASEFFPARVACSDPRKRLSQHSGVHACCVCYRGNLTPRSDLAFCASRRARDSFPPPAFWSSPFYKSVGRAVSNPSFVACRVLRRQSLGLKRGLLRLLPVA